MVSVWRAAKKRGGGANKKGGAKKGGCGPVYAPENKLFVISLFFILSLISMVYFERVTNPTIETRLNAHCSDIKIKKRFDKYLQFAFKHIFSLRSCFESARLL